MSSGLEMPSQRMTVKDVSQGIVGCHPASGLQDTDLLIWDTLAKTGLYWLVHMSRWLESCSCLILGLNQSTWSLRPDHCYPVRHLVILPCDGLIVGTDSYRLH